ncbi:hypothetical protein M758_9G032500 [Ceratodon purpureus]|nr:hypothetical protein M758_9G032500 [Ceratodon purpureus]
MCIHVLEWSHWNVTSAEYATTLDPGPIATSLVADVLLPYSQDDGAEAIRSSLSRSPAFSKAFMVVT